jgi:geranylgeranyl pyrophosphate synthase
VRTDLHDEETKHLAAISTRMNAGFQAWPWPNRDRMRILVERQLARRGKRLRPRFALLCARLLGAALERAEPVAAAVELYHCASLVLDDVQDNSNFRGDAPAVHVTENVSNAINLGCIVRSFSHYPIDCADLALSEKDRLRRHLDVMETLVPLGQSMDIGWNQGWYDFQSFPHREMMRLKTGAPFACVAAGAAVVSGADEKTENEIERLGYEVGILYQLVDDYHDMFITDPQTVPDDLVGGKFTRPIAILIDLLRAQSHDGAAERVARNLQNPKTAEDLTWVRDLLTETSVSAMLSDEIKRSAEEIERRIFKLALGGDAAVDRMVEFVHQLVRMTNGPS